MKQFTQARNLIGVKAVTKVSETNVNFANSFGLSMRMKMTFLKLERLLMTKKSKYLWEGFYDRSSLRNLLVMFARNLFDDLTP